MSTAIPGNPSGPGSKLPSRFGPTAIIKETNPSEDAHLLPLFAKNVDIPSHDRRLSPRFPALEQRAWLGWWSETGAFASTPARLENISQGGAKLVMANPPPVQQVVWLCLGVPSPTECVQAKVLAVIPDLQGDAVIRLAFGAPCPLNFYRIAINGLPGQGPGGV